MSTSSEVASALRDFASDTRLRLYHVTLPQGGERLLVEAFFAVEELQTMGTRDLIVLSTDGALGVKKLLGKPASLGLTLADGKRCTFSGIISEAAMLGGDGGLVRYRLRLTSFLWLLSQCRNHYVWQDY